MKSTIAILLTATALMLQGCALIRTSKEKPGYESGRLSAITYISARPFLTPAQAEAIRAGYTVLKSTIAEDPLDSFVKAEINRLYPDTTIEFRQMVWSYYKIARQDISGELAAQINLPTPVILSNFVEGVESILSVTKVSEEG